MRVSGWGMSWVGGSIVLLLAGSLNSPARACTGPCSSPMVLMTQSGQVAAGGTLLLACRDCVGTPAPIEAVDAAEGVTSGQLEVVAESADPTWINVAQATQYLRWKPAQPLAAGSYRLRAVQKDSYCAENALAKEWTVPAAEPPRGALTTSAELSEVQAGLGTRFGCADLCDAKFTYTRRGPVPSIWITPQLPTSDPRFATHIVRLVAELPEGDQFASWGQLETLRIPAGEREFIEDEALFFTERRKEYCVALEVFDVVADERERIGRTCIADDLGELRSTANLISPNICRLEGPRADYDAAFCRDNRDECSSGVETAACGAWKTLCKSEMPIDAGQDASEPDASVAADASTPNEPDAASATDAATPNDPDAASADAATKTPDAGATPAPTRANTGCDCSTATDGNWQPTGAVWSVLLLSYLHRRRLRPRAPRPTSRA